MYNGFMTASFVDYMEQNAYDQAVRSYCLPARESQRVAMPELFDTIAGSETGAIIGSALVIKNSSKDPKVVAMQPN
jgi:DNA primase